MRRFFSALLLAASTLVPTIATAQDEDPASRGSAWRSQRGADRPAPQPPQQAAPVQQPQRPAFENRGGPRRDDGNPAAAARGRGNPGWQRLEGQTGFRPDPGNAAAGRERWQGWNDWRGDRGQPDAASRPAPPQAFNGNRGPDDRQRFDGSRDDRRRFDGANRADGSRWNQPGRFDPRRNDTARDDWTRSRLDRNDQWRDGNRFDNRADWNRNGGNWSRTWRQDNRFDYGRYRAENRFAYHLPRYYAPYGWQYGYRRFGLGVTLNSILFADQYWIDDPYDYRLPPAYGPYRWVRYYNDALLVDIRYGTVVDTVYDIFW